jgi:hypothetical protein
MGPVKWHPVVSKVRNAFSTWDVGRLSRRPLLDHQTYWAIKMDGLWADGVRAPTKLTAVRLRSCAEPSLTDASFWFHRQ